MAFKDYFGGNSPDYARFRPTYPAALYTYMTGLAPGRELAWDCATGSGQAALGLASYFARVVATDASDRQIAAATPHPRIEYRVTPAETSLLVPASVDIVTVAQALHWLDLDAFYAEVRRVLKPNAVIAVWCYSLMRVAPKVDAVVDRYYRDIVGPYWPPERAYVDAHYRTLAFPFAEIAAPPFRMETRWTFEDFVGYIDTWSATQQYRRVRGDNPLEQVREPLVWAWGPDHPARTIVWPLHLRIAKV